MEIFKTRATTLGWGDPGVPGSTAGRAYERANIVTMDLDGVPPLRVHRGAVPLFTGFLRDLLATGYVIERGQLDDWGYNLRWKNILGNPWVGHLSEHSNGTAVDINARTNPQGKPLRTNMNAATVRRLAAKWGLRWGGEFSTPDPMHFEVIVKPADVAAIVARNTGTPPSTGGTVPANRAGSGAGSAPTASRPAGTGKSAFSGVSGAVWRLIVEGALVLGGIGAVVLGANRAAGGAPGRVVKSAAKTAAKIGAMA